MSRPAFIPVYKASSALVDVTDHAHQNSSIAKDGTHLNFAEKTGKEHLLI